MSSLAIKGNGLQSKLLWAAVIALGALSFGIVALSRGENVNAAWLVIAAVCIYLIAYRFYALFVAEKVLGVDPTRQTPAYQHAICEALALGRASGVDLEQLRRVLLGGSAASWMLDKLGSAMIAGDTAAGFRIM
jgi:hypothetical protein